MQKRALEVKITDLEKKLLSKEENALEAKIIELEKKLVSKDEEVENAINSQSYIESLNLKVMTSEHLKRTS